LYNTNAVVQATGVPAETIRAWERRHGLPRPFRTPTRQRLYSEQDIGVISWLRERTNEGMTISQAIQRLRLELPDLAAGSAPATPQPAASDDGAQITSLRERLIEACAEFDTSAADRIVDEALARLSIDGFCISYVEPLLEEIAERQSRQGLNVAAGHFALRLLSRRLAALVPLVSTIQGRGTILIAAPAGDEQDVGSLMLTILLSRRGWRVVELGANVPAGVLVVASDAVRPDFICLRAATAHAAAQSLSVAQLVVPNDNEPPEIILSGSAFTPEKSRRSTSGVHLAANVHEVLTLIEQLSKRFAPPA
jgi:DNA-binding transcriptional MerR regulator